MREIEFVGDVYRLSQRHHCARARIVAVYRFILMPLRLRKRSQNLFHLRAERRRDYCFREETYPRALFRLLLIDRRADLADKSGPRADVFAIRERLRTIRIVKTENGCLSEDVGRA